jgi:hypothetical protein
MHPSSNLRQPPENRHEEIAKFIADLKVGAKLLNGKP